ncbi:MAG: glycosyltransferase family 4 protein [Protaetiibacter sp.]
MTVFDDRRRALAAAVGASADADDAALCGHVVRAGGRGAYAALAFLHGRIPTEQEVVRTHARLLEGPAETWAELVRVGRRRSRRRALPVVPVSGVIADVTDTASSPYTTGIQRVARELVAAWSTVEPVVPAVWNPRTGELRAASPEEAARAGARPSTPALLVPIDARLVLPEIAVDPDRAQRLAAIARFGARASLAIGFDCIPITTGETAGPGMPGAFARYLAGIARFDVVCAISAAARTEFEGWARMLPSAGLSAPRIVDVELPVVPISAIPEPEREVRSALELDAAPLVLVVGSHEPRKNHLAILTAFELAWRRGHEFSVVLVGGNSWKADEFLEFSARLQSAGRPLRLVSNASDERLARLYRMSTATVFCSLNEGYGLPIAESLAVGTPVVTADFGSQRDVGAGRGAILVDPGDVEAISAAVESLLTDSALRARLVSEAARVTPASWSDYADRIRRELPDGVS